MTSASYTPEPAAWRLLIQMAKRLGATVISTASTDTKVGLASSAGADHVINYTEEDFGEAVERLVGPKSLDVVFDGVGASTLDTGLTLLRPRGTMVLFGQSSGVVPPFDLGRLASLGSLFITRPMLLTHIAARADLERRAGRGPGLDHRRVAGRADPTPLPDSRGEHGPHGTRSTPHHRQGPPSSPDDSPPHCQN